MRGTMPGARRRARSRTAWVDNISTWTGLPLKKSIRMTDNRDKWRKYVCVVALWPTLGSRTAKEQDSNRLDYEITNTIKKSGELCAVDFLQKK